MKRERGRDCVAASGVLALGLGLLVAHGTPAGAVVGDPGAGLEDGSESLIFQNPEGWGLEEIADELEEAEVIEVVAEFVLESDVITVGVFPEEGDSADEVLAEIEITLADMTDGQAVGVPRDSASDTSAVGEAYEQAGAQAASGDVVITRIVLARNSSVPSELSAHSVREIQPSRLYAEWQSRQVQVQAELGSAPVGRFASPLVPGATQTAASANCESTWRPNYVKMIALSSTTSGQRYGRLRFEWTSSSRLNNLKSCPGVTFEPDFVTNNYDGKYYFSKTIKSWSSNLPSSYWDTSFADGGQERVYTVGTSDARRLVANREYTTYFRATNGNSKQDSMKVVAQRGVRIPSVCHSTWCIFARDSQRYPAANASTPWLTIPTAGRTVTR